MNKSEFKNLRSSFRAIKPLGTSMEEKLKSLSEQQDKFSKDFGFDFWSVRKPSARNSIVSIRVACKLNFPDWCLKSPSFN